MAIRKRADRPAPYQVYWNNPYTGKRESKSFVTLKEARAHDSLVQHQLAHEREIFRQDTVREGADRTVEDAVYLYLKEKGFSPRDTDKFLSAMRSVFGHIGHIPLEMLTAEHVRDMQTSMKSEKSLRHKTETHDRDGKVRQKDAESIPTISAATIHNRLSKLRTVLRWAAENEMLQSVPVIKIISPGYKKFIPPNAEEVGAIFSVAAPHLQRVILIGVSLGARVGESELLVLTWDHVDLSSGILLVNTSRKNKAQPMREVPIREDLLPLFRAWKAEDMSAGIRYLIHYDGKPIKSIKTAWKATLKRSGVERHFRPYDLRHAFATELIGAGVDMGTVAELMGHSSISMLFKHYQFVPTPQKRRAVESLPAYSMPVRPCAQ